jgi:hypothetical protein
LTVEARESVGTEYLVSDPAPTTTAPGASWDGWPTWLSVLPYFFRCRKTRATLEEQNCY